MAEEAQTEGFISCSLEEQHRQAASGGGLCHADTPGDPALGVHTKRCSLAMFFGYIAGAKSCALSESLQKKQRAERKMGGERHTGQRHTGQRRQLPSQPLPHAFGMPYALALFDL